MDINQNEAFAPIFFRKRTTPMVFDSLAAPEVSAD